MMAAEHIFPHFSNRNYRVSYRQGRFYPQKRFYFFFWEDRGDSYTSLNKAYKACK